MSKRVLPLRKETFSQKKLTMPPIAGFDFETEGLGGKFIVAAIWTSDNHRELFTSLAEFFDWIINHPQYRYLAHNAVGYEFAYLAPYIYDYFTHNDNVDITPTIQGDSRIVQFRITIFDEEATTGTGRRRKPAKTVIDLRDTLCMFSMSLEKVAQAFCPELPKLKHVINFEKETFDLNNPDHIAYVFRDCEIVIRAYERHWNNVVRVFGCPLGVTAGSTALKAFKTTIGEGKAYWRLNEKADALVRNCYYGGLVLPGRSIGNWGRVGSVDVNGAYAFQMDNHSYPIGTPFATHHYHPEFIGFYHVIATVPPSVFDTLGFNPIPCRTNTGLTWPTGSFDTHITSPEIEYARSKGCTIEIIDGYCFTKSEHVFHEFVEKCQTMELAENGVYKPSIKQIRNSGYGKFGSKPTHKTIVYSKENFLFGYYPMENENTGERIEGLFIGEETTQAEYMLPHWAALITAYERLYIMQFAEECYRRGAKNVYCDTDSIKCDLDVIVSMVSDGTFPVHNNYGGFKVEETCEEFILLGSKCFYGTGEKPLIKAKGLPKRVSKSEHGERQDLPIEAYQNALKGEREEWWFDSVLSVMNIIKENSSVRPIRRKRKITDIRNSASWQLSKDDKIYPACYPIAA